MESAMVRLELGFPHDDLTRPGPSLGPAHLGLHRGSVTLQKAQAPTLVAYRIAIQPAGARLVQRRLGFLHSSRRDALFCLPFVTLRARQEAHCLSGFGQSAVPLAEQFQ